MALLTSEICRLILGFLEEENLHKTYETFLAESKYLDECRIYLKKGIKFQKTVHGKNLIQHLNHNFERTFNSVNIQTDSNENTINLKYKNDTDAQTENILLETPIIINQSPPKIQIQKQPDEGRSNFKKRKSCNFKRKNPLLTPTKSFKPIESTTIPIEPVDLFENFDESLLDLDSFIKNLCENDFPEKLAQSINQLNAKKCTSTEPTDQIIKENQPCSTTENPPVQSISPKIQIPIEIQPQQQKIPEQRQTQPPTQANDSIQIVNEPENLNDQSAVNSIKFWIANEDISVLAEHYSEPAFETLFEVFNSSHENSHTENVKMDIDEVIIDNTIQIKVIENQNEQQKLATIDQEEDKVADKMNETIILDNSDNNIESTIEKCPVDTKPKEPINLICSVSSDRKSMIVIGKNFEEVEKVTEKWREMNKEEEENLTGLECLAKAASEIKQCTNEELKENLNEEIDSTQTSTPNKSLKQGENSNKRPKTIREIYDEEKKVNELEKKDIVVSVEPSEKLDNSSKIEKKESKRVKNKNYFYDFYQDIKNEIEENNNDDDDEMPDIFRYARNVQNRVKQKLMCQNKNKKICNI
ncbi:unnamed protein product [Brachionus calyciflorus]|uniref:LisH domain-containing protein n=1 Tax=Brachionus calyciflorus TaxID=104777 RepID=A0A813XFX9_9BILA|nr:unnamed protein product [Brachionus calyciflorus]